MVSDDEANGTYLNYLQMSGLLVLPIFKKKTDEKVVRLFEQLFKKEVISTVNCNDIASDGGILNCISWNIQVD